MQLVQFPVQVPEHPEQVPVQLVQFPEQVPVQLVQVPVHPVQLVQLVEHKPVQLAAHPVLDAAAVTGFDSATVIFASNIERFGMGFPFTFSVDNSDVLIALNGVNILL